MRPAPILPAAARLGLCVLLSAAVSGCFLVPQARTQGIDALEEGDFLLGAWLGSWPGDDNDIIQDFERKAGTRLHLVDVYLDWSTPFSNVRPTLDHIAESGAIAMLSWEPHGLTTEDIVTGTKTLGLRGGDNVTLDEYLKDFAAGTCAAAKLAEQPIFLRTLHEMNGPWFSWGIGSAPENTASSHKQAWVKVHDAFADRCGERVRFVWGVNHFSEGEGLGFATGYPGDAYVDYVAIDGYNWGGHADWGWTTFEDLFTKPYCALTGKTTKPVLITEVASTEKDGDKGVWIRAMFDDLDRFSQVQGIVWFHDTKYEAQIDAEMDWPIDSSPTARQAFEQAAQEMLERRTTAPPDSDRRAVCDHVRSRHGPGRPGAPHGPAGLRIPQAATCGASDRSLPPKILPTDATQKETLVCGPRNDLCLLVPHAALQITQITARCSDGPTEGPPCQT